MLKQYDRIREELLKKILKKDENVFHAEKLFMAVSVLNWIADQKPDPHIYEKYMSYIGKYLYNEINLYWEHGVIKLKAIRNKNDG